MHQDTELAVLHFDSIAVQLRDIGDSLGQLGRTTGPAALRDDVRAAYREFADRLAAWREQVTATVTTTDTVGAAQGFAPGDRVRLLTIGQDGKLDGGHRPAVLDHIGHDGFARVRADGIGLPLVVELDRLILETVTELDFARGLDTPATVRPCLSWCDNPGHADEAPADRACWSEDRAVALNVMPWHRGLPIIVETGAVRDVNAIEALVTMLVKNGPEELSTRMTSWEARRLAADLLHFADMAKEK